MMRQFLFVSVIFLSSIFTAFAQHSSEIDKITTGHIKFNFDFSSKDPSMAQTTSMFKNSEMDLFFAPARSKAEMDMGMMKITVTTNTKSGKALMLLGGMAGNIAVPFTTEEAKEMSKEAESQIEISYTDETQTIAGYKCKKAIVTQKDGGKSIFWYTEEFEVQTEGQQYFNSQLPGVSLKFELEQGGMKVVGTAVEISLTLPEDASTLFNTSIPEGYKEMTLQEIKSMGLN